MGRVTGPWPEIPLVPYCASQPAVCSSVLIVCGLVACREDVRLTEGGTLQLRGSWCWGETLQWDSYCSVTRAC